jgi:pectinesterase
VTAQYRTSPTQTTGFVITHSRITATIAPRSTPLPADPTQTALVQDGFSLGRPWRPYSRVVVMHTQLPPELFLSHWSRWKDGDPTPQAFYAEFRNTGPGAQSRQVAPWARTLTPAQAEAFAPAHFLAGPPSGPAHWDPLAAAAALP